MSRITWWLALVLALGLAMRLGFIGYLHTASPDSQSVDVPGQEDQKDYDTTARNILAGNGFWSSDLGGSLYDAEPGYPLFVAAAYAVSGKRILAVKIFQALLGTLSCLLLFYLGDRLAGPTVGLLAAFALAIHPNHVYYSAFVLSETVRVFVVIAMLLAVMEALRRQTVRWYVIGGLLVGAAAMTRFVVLPYLVALAAVLWLVDRPSVLGWKGPAVLLLAGIAVLTPWSVRNYAHTGVLSPVNLSAGQMLVEGSDPASVGRLDNRSRWSIRESLQDDSRQARREVAGKGLFYSVWKVAGLWWTRVTETPVETAGLLLRRVGAFWKLYPQGGGYAVWVLQAYSLVVNLSIFLLGLVGVFARYIPTRERVVLILLVAVFMSVHMLYHGIPMRYRMPVEPVLILFAAAGVARIMQWRKGATWEIR